jgi:DNA-binding GntR family transcriptional regulator
VIVLELSVREALDVIDVQACLEQFAIARIFEDGRRLDVAELQRLLDIQRQAVAAGNRRKFLEYDRKMHLTIIRGAGNSKLATVMENASDLMMYGGHRALQNEVRMRETVSEHEALVHALAADSLETALSASKAHIQGAKRRLLS